MAVGNTKEFSAEDVGDAFVTQFYLVLHKSPELVGRFFSDSSTMSRPGPDATMKVANTTKEIDDLILSLDCKDNKVEILTIDAQASHYDGIIVLVTGCLTSKDNERRKFTESFFLAPQDKGYFVLNNVFRFVVADNLPPVEFVEDKDKVSDENSSVAPLTSVQETIDARGDQSNKVEVPIDIKIEPNNLGVNEPTSTVVEKAAPPAPIASKPTPEVLSNVHVDAPKKSWASLLKNVSDGASSSLVRVTTRAARPAAAPKAAQPPVTSVARQASPGEVPVTAPESSVSSASNGNGSGADAIEDKGHSIYVGDLPFNASIELVEQEFKQFGRIKQGGVQVRVNKGYYFGFVEYEDASAQQKAVEMRTMIINGKRAFIQEKKTSTRVANGAGTYPSGRGGYRGDGFRGQGKYSNERGYSKNEYNKRHNGDVPSRTSNRNGHRNPGEFQNGGERGAHQPAAAAK